MSGASPQPAAPNAPSSSIAPSLPLSLGVTTSHVGPALGLLVEFVLTFALMFVILAMATDARAPAGLAPLAIGATVAFDALLGGALTGASMNPARSFGPALITGERGSASESQCRHSPLGGGERPRRDPPVRGCLGARRVDTLLTIPLAVAVPCAVWRCSAGVGGAVALEWLARRCSGAGEDPSRGADAAQEG